MFKQQRHSINIKQLAWLTLQLHVLKVKLPESQLSGLIDPEKKYELRPVAGSNVFLILKQRHPNDEDKCCNSQVRQITYCCIKKVNILLLKTAIPNGSTYFSLS